MKNKSQNFSGFIFFEAGRFASQATNGSFSGSQMLGVAEKFQQIQGMYDGNANQMDKQSTIFSTANKQISSKGMKPMAALEKTINHALDNSKTVNKVAASEVNSINNNNGA